MAIFLKHLQLFIIILLLTLISFALAQNGQFIYNGFKEADTLLLDGLAKIRPNGLLQLTNFSSHFTSHAFYPIPMNFKPNMSFSTTFVFTMVPQVPHHAGHGIVFVISSNTNFQYSLPSAYLGLFNVSTNGLSSNHVFGVELDTVENADVGDMNDNHVGIDINSVRSSDASTASYFSDKDGTNKTLQLNGGSPMQIWIDYDGIEMLLNVTLAPIGYQKPSKCLLSSRINLSSLFVDSMYIGFSSSTGQSSNSHYILGWSWNQNGPAKDLDLSKLPSLPRIKHQRQSSNLIFLALLIIVVLLSMIIAGGAWVIMRKKYNELYEPWEKEYDPHRFSFKDLYLATKGFRSSEILGAGGFGKVYRGVLPSIHTQVAVKQVSHDSRQGMKQFVAEIASMRRLRHRNLVQLLGYCRRKGKLLLVYEYMPNGSLDKFLFNKDDKLKLDWSQRFKIIKGVASALVYLHEEWEQVVLHRDVKASNVLLDADMNARLGDFGLARLYDHNTDPRTTNVVGTIGYIAPEASRTWKPTTNSDVYSFGVFLFEVACGRRPLELKDVTIEDFFLVDWVYDCWKRGAILEASDLKLEGNYVTGEMGMVLKLGLLCSHSEAEARPTMRQVVQVLNGVAMLPEISSDYDPKGGYGFSMEGWTSSSYPSSSKEGFSFNTDSILTYPR